MRTRSPRSFDFKLTGEEIRRHRDADLSNKKGMLKEHEAMAAGSKIAAGGFSLENLLPVIVWKSPRSLGRVRSNHPEDIADALRLALAALTCRAGMATLCGLRRVDVSVASAILTAIDPERYTVVDRRALKTLGVQRPAPTIDDYVDYLEFCTAKAKELGLCLRDLDRALWHAGG